MGAATDMFASNLSRALELGTLNPDGVVDHSPITKQPITLREQLRWDHQLDAAEDDLLADDFGYGPEGLWG